MTSAATLTPTFRDPAGSLHIEGDWAVRHIYPAARPAVLQFLESPFCRRLQERGDLIDAIIEDLGGAGGSLRLLHPRVPIPAYPWEWTVSQWQAAGELTLRLCEEGLAEGWILKDATPLNILFIGNRPVLVDILSFEQRDPAAQIWLAYGQYARTFLLPLLMRRMLGWPLALSLFSRDGYEPSALFTSLSWRQRLSRSAIWPITLPALLERRNGGSTKPASTPSTQSADPELSRHVLMKTLRDLRRRTQRAMPAEASSEWSEYGDTLTHYTPEQSAQKRAWVGDVLALCSAGRILDVGANTGEYSRLAAESGAQVVALERDPAAADRIFRMSRSLNLNIQTLQADLARPTPAVGWENAESSALLPRLEGQFDLVLMLAVIHHLILMEQVPIPAIIALCERLTTRYLVIEWVPVEDPMFQSLMRGRDTLYGGLREDDLLQACAGRFQVMRREPLGNGRVLILLARRLPAGA